MIEKGAVSGFSVALPEPVAFVIKSGMFLIVCTAILYVLFAAGYPAVHDALHKFRHALAVVPCH